MEGPNLAAKNDHHVIMLSDAVGVALPCPALSAAPSPAPNPEKAQRLGTCWLRESWAWKVPVRDKAFFRGLMPAVGRPGDCQPDLPRGLSVALGSCSVGPPSERAGPGRRPPDNLHPERHRHSRLVS